MESTPNSFFVRQIGTSGPPVVLLHGFGNSSLMWLPFVFPLRKKFSFFIVDLPGHGRSKHVPLVHSDVLLAYAKCIETVISQHQLKDVRLVGFSLGAYATLHFLTSFSQEEIRCFLSIDHPPWGQNDDGWSLGLRQELLKLFEKLTKEVDNNPELVDLTLESLPPTTRDLFIHILEVIGQESFSRVGIRWLNSKMYQIPFTREQLANRIAWPWGFAAIKQYYLGTHDLRPLLSKILVPVTALGSKAPVLFGGDYLPYLKSNIPSAKIIYFDKSGHDLMFNEPLKFFSIFTKFLYQFS